MRKDGKRKSENALAFVHLAILFLLPTLLLISSCTNAQEDKLLYRDTILNAKVYQSDLNNYLQQKGKIDTVGMIKGFIKIIASAKFLSGDIPDVISARKLTYEEALIKAEENFRVRNLVNKVLVVKNERKMYLLKDGKTIKTFPIALGPNPIGQKEYEGDGRTPEGSYTLDWQRHDTPVFHSYHISYPNKADSVRANSKGLKPGSNIMIHGYSKGVKKKKDWTNGCIALTNADMVEFRKIVFQDTEIEIRK